MKRPATFIEYLNNPERYAAFHGVYSSRPPIDVRSPQVQRNLDTLMGPVPHLVPRGIGPVAITTGPDQGASSIIRGLAGMDAPTGAPRVSLSDVAMLPLMTAEQQERQAPLPPPAPFGIPAGGINDAKVAPPDAARPVLNGVDAYNASSPLRPPMRGAFGRQAPRQPMSPLDWIASAVIGRQ